MFSSPGCERVRLVFERFSDRGRRVLVLAQEETRLLHHVFIGTEHILLALLSEGEGLACRALESKGLTLASARDEVLRGAEGGPETARQRSPPFTSDAKRALELALSEMLMFDDKEVGTEHVLLGLIRQADNAATEVMVGCGVDPGDVRRKVIELMQAEPARRLKSLREQLHLAQGMAVAVEHWDDVSAAALGARDRKEAIETLRGPPLHLSAEQARHVLNMPVGQLASDERERLSEELRRLEVSISDVRDQPGPQSL